MNTINNNYQYNHHNL